MQIKKAWDPRLDELLRGLEAPIEKIKSQMVRVEPLCVRRALQSINNDLSAIVGSTIDLCKRPGKLSSLVAATLLRSLIDCAVSAFAFCRGPEDLEHRAHLYLDFGAILDFKHSCAAERHMGTRWVSLDHAEAFQNRKNNAAAARR